MINSCKNRWLIVAISVLLFVIVGCSGGDKGSSSATDSSGTTATVESTDNTSDNAEVSTAEFSGQKIEKRSDLPDPENLDKIQVGIINYDATKGPIVDRVVFDARSDETIALKDTAAGKTDVFGSSVQASVFKSLPEADQDKLETYVVPELSWSLLLNPIPNEAPYTVDVSGATYFNPFAIKEVRQAMNWLIDRKKIIDEIAYGEGTPMFVAQTPGQPGTYRYNLIASKFGMTENGDESYAIETIDAAMRAAANLPANKGKLVNEGGFWKYDGSDVTIKFLIRVDDPSGRLLAGHYIADQIEKAGIKVERLEWDRSRCGNAVYGGDPANFEWQLYTEGWGSGATRRWWDITISQMYAPYYGYMPGGATEGYWNYQNDEIDRLAQKSYYGKFLTADEYWTDNLKALELALDESVRIYLASLNSYFLVNEERSANRMLYGMADGIANFISFVSADVQPNADGEKVLRVTQHSAQGSLFMDVWDPISGGGFSSTYSNLMAQTISNKGTFEAPHTAADTPLAAEWSDLSTSVSYNADNELVGGIAVPANAMKYDSATKAWVEVGSGTTSFSKGSSTYRYGRWHHGAEQTLADIMYASAFITEWATKDGEDDPYYEQSYSAIYTPGLETSKGFILNNDGTFTSYFDYNWPMDEGRVGSNATVSGKAGSPGRPYVFPWDLYEAASLLVVEGNTKGERYTIAQSADLKQLDLKTPDMVADLRAKYVELYNRGHVPVSIKDYVTVEEAKDRYARGIKFIDTYGHGMISNGAFFISKIDAANNFIELSAFRDAAYPFEQGYWRELFSTDMTRIDYVDIPAVARKSQGLTFTAVVSQYTYPEVASVDADGNTKVKALVIDESGNEYEITSNYSGYGEFVFNVNSATLANMASGRYTIVVMSAIADETPATSTHVINLN